MIHPWRRFSARIVDEAVLSCVLFWFVFPLQADLKSILFISLVPFLKGFVFTLVEMGLMMTWGTTPGKCLLGVKVITAGGNKISPWQGFRRSIGVYWFGKGLGIPIMNLWAYLNAYSRLKEDKRSTWDRKTMTRIKVTDIAWYRIPVAVIIMLCPIIIILYRSGLFFV